MTTVNVQTRDFVPHHVGNLPGRKSLGTTWGLYIKTKFLGSSPGLTDWLLGETLLVVAVAVAVAVALAVAVAVAVVVVVVVVVVAVAVAAVAAFLEGIYFFIATLLFLFDGISLIHPYLFRMLFYKFWSPNDFTQPEKSSYIGDMFHLEDSTFIRMMSSFFWWVNHNGSWLLGLVLLVVGKTPILRLNSIRWSTRPMAKLMVRSLRSVSRYGWWVFQPPKPTWQLKQKTACWRCVSRILKKWWFSSQPS